MAFELPPLPYAVDALAPYMSAETLELHHGKHHQAYVTNLNNLTKDTPLADKTLDEIVKASFGDASKQGIFNNAGQHWNHLLFWQAMKPNGGGSIPGALESRLIDSFGSLDKFKADFIAAGTTQFGSGWAWLVVGADGKLAVSKTANGENPLAHGQTALLGVDVWEHAYYVDYRNRRPDYLKAFVENLVNWEFVAERLAAAS
jgi:superoxide dismutase, Fe-Mn family